MSDLPTSAPASADRSDASPTTEAFAVRIGYIWLMVLAPVAGFVLGLLGLFAGGAALLLLGVALLALGYWAWRRGYRAVQLVLTPEHLRVQPAGPAAPREDIPLSRIASYLRPQESYYQILDLQLHDGGQLRFSKRLRTPPAGALTFDDWAEVLASRLEQARPVVAAGEPAPASGLLAGSPHVFARTTMGKILAGAAAVCLLLAGLAALGGAHVSGAMFIAPGLYLGYYFRARGALKVTTSTYAYTGTNTRRDQTLQNDLDDMRERTFDELNRFS